MEPGEFPGLGRGERRAFFIGPDHLVLGAVVLEDPADVGQKGNGHDVAEKEHQFEQAVPDMEAQGLHAAGQTHRLHAQGKEVRRHHEKQQREADGGGQGEPHGPWPDFGLVLLHGHLGRVVERLDAVDQGFEQDGKSADEGLFEPLGRG